MKETNQIWLLTGSNIGDRAENLRRAAEKIATEIGEIARQSSVYETEPWGLSEQNWFFNQAFEVHSSLSARQILEKIKTIELEMGRERLEKNGPRLIDLDLLFFGDEEIDEPGLRVPHPEIASRNFVLVPLMEIAPDLIHPTLRLPIDDLYMASTDPLEVIFLDHA